MPPLSTRQCNPTVPSVLKAGLICGMFCLSVALQGCSHPRKSDTPPATNLSLQGGSVSLAVGGLAILTPVATTGSDVDQQAVALIFADALSELRPDLPVAPLSKTLPSIAAAGLVETYSHMYETYKNTGLFDAKVLRTIGQAVGARYLVQLNISSFDEESSGGLLTGLIGVGVVHKTTGKLRVTARIWDSTEGKVVFEGSNEASEKKRSLIVDRSVKVDDVAKSASEAIIKQIPKA
jgi:hypothetical protein